MSDDDAWLLLLLLLLLVLVVLEDLVLQAGSMARLVCVVPLLGTTAMRVCEHVHVL